jgi:hypothetical protein
LVAAISIKRWLRGEGGAAEMRGKGGWRWRRWREKKKIELITG